MLVPHTPFRVQLPTTNSPAPSPRLDLGPPVPAAAAAWARRSVAQALHHRPPARGPAVPAAPAQGRKLVEPGTRTPGQRRAPEQSAGRRRSRARAELPGASARASPPATPPRSPRSPNEAASRARLRTGAGATRRSPGLPGRRAATGRRIGRAVLRRGGAAAAPSTLLRIDREVHRGSPPAGLRGSRAVGGVLAPCRPRARAPVPYGLSARCLRMAPRSMSLRSVDAVAVGFRV